MNPRERLEKLRARHAPAPGVELADLARGVEKQLAKENKLVAFCFDFWTREGNPYPWVEEITRVALRGGQMTLHFSNSAYAYCADRDLRDGLRDETIKAAPTLKARQVQGRWVHESIRTIRTAGA